VAWSRSPLRPRQLRWQVAQHPGLAAAQRLQQRPRLGGRPRSWPASRLRMSATRAAWAVRCRHDAPGRGGLQQERHHHAIGFGQVQCALQGVSSGGRAAERAAGDRLQRAGL